MPSALHNPARLTRAQIGPKPWRLLTRDEISMRANKSQEVHVEIECWVPDSGWDRSRWIGNDDDCTYRTKLTRKQLAALD